MCTCLHACLSCARNNCCEEKLRLFTWQEVTKPSVMWSLYEWEKETECSKPLYNAYRSCIGACFFLWVLWLCEPCTTRAFNDVTAQLHYVSMLCCIDVKWDGRLCFTSSCNSRWQLPDTSFDCYCTVWLSSYWFILIPVQTYTSINHQLQNRSSLMTIKRPTTYITKC